jgi:hypothetical protein
LFIDIIAYYINKDWMIQEELIGFESLKDIYSGVALTEVINRLLTKYNIAY